MKLRVIVITLLALLMAAGAVWYESGNLLASLFQYHWSEQIEEAAPSAGYLGYSRQRKTLDAFSLAHQDWQALKAHWVGSVTAEETVRPGKTLATNQDTDQQVKQLEAFLHVLQDIRKELKKIHRNIDQTCLIQDTKDVCLE